MKTCMRLAFILLPAVLLGMLGGLIHVALGWGLLIGMAYVGFGVTEARAERGEG